MALFVLAAYNIVLSIIGVTYLVVCRPKGYRLDFTICLVFLGMLVSVSSLYTLRKWGRSGAGEDRDRMESLRSPSVVFSIVFILWIYVIRAFE